MPSPINEAEYRLLLKALDRVMLDRLDQLGAHSGADLAKRVTRGPRNRWVTLIEGTSDETGIVEMTEATATDWVNVAWRRGLVSPWPSRSHESTTLDPGEMICVTEQGKATTRSWGERNASGVVAGVAGLLGSSLIAGAFRAIGHSGILVPVVAIAVYLVLVTLVTAAAVSRSRAPHDLDRYP